MRYTVVTAFASTDSVAIRCYKGCDRTASPKRAKRCTLRMGEERLDGPRCCRIGAAPDGATNMNRRSVRGALLRASGRVESVGGRRGRRRWGRGRERGQGHPLSFVPRRLLQPHLRAPSLTRSLSRYRWVDSGKIPYHDGASSRPRRLDAGAFVIRHDGRPNRMSGRRTAPSTMGRSVRGLSPRSVPREALQQSNNRGVGGGGVTCCASPRAGDAAAMATATRSPPACKTGADFLVGQPGSRPSR